VAGEELALRYRLLQHGVTPVDHGTVLVTATLPETGERLVVEATSAGDGEWVATMTLPTTCDWQIVVAHADLETSGVAPLTVLDAGSGAAFASPGLPVLLALAAVAVMVLAGITGLGRSRAGRRREASVGATAKG
jgi:hypothetical protein